MNVILSKVISYHKFTGIIISINIFDYWILNNYPKSINN